MFIDQVAGAAIHREAGEWTRQSGPCRRDEIHDRIVCGQRGAYASARVEIGFEELGEARFEEQALAVGHFGRIERMPAG